MDPRKAYHVLREHMLYIDAPRNFFGLPWLQSVSSTLESSSGSAHLDSVRRVLRDLGDTVKADPGVHHAWQHIRLVAEAESREAKKCPAPTCEQSALHASHSSPVHRHGSPSMSSTAGQEGGQSSGPRSAHTLFAALVALCRSSERHPVPQVTLMELVRSLAVHMSFHRQSFGNVVSGEYVLKALSRFLNCNKQDALFLYAIPLIDVGCLRMSSRQQFSLNGLMDSSLGATVARFEKWLFIVAPPWALNLRKFPLREALSRLVCVFCHRSCVEGGNELIYLSHSRWLFSAKPQVNESGLPLDSPFSPFPEHLRRGFLGPLMQFVTSFCMIDCGTRDAQNSQCAIVRLDGVKLAVMQLSPSNVALLVVNPEMGAMDRSDCPVSILLGFPEHLPDQVIHLAVRQMLDSVELLDGPRDQLAFNLNGDDAASLFRDRCRRIGQRMFAMCSALVFHPEAPGVMFGRASLDSDMVPFLDRGIQQRRRMETARRSTNSGLPSAATYALLHKPWAKVLSRQTCTRATDLLLRCKEACRPLGGTLAAAVFFHGRVVLADSNPYLASLLQLLCVGLDNEQHWDGAADSPRATDPTCETSAVPSPSEWSGKVVQETVSSRWTGLPPGFQLPRGVFSDETFSSVASKSKARKASERGTPPSPNGAQCFSAFAETVEDNVGDNCTPLDETPRAASITVKEVYLSPAVAQILESTDNGAAPRLTGKYLCARFSLWGIDVVLLTAFRVDGGSFPAALTSGQWSDKEPGAVAAVVIAAEQLLREAFRDTVHEFLTLLRAIVRFDCPQRSYDASGDANRSATPLGSGNGHAGGRQGGSNASGVLALAGGTDSAGFLTASPQAVGAVADTAIPAPSRSRTSQAALGASSAPGALLKPSPAPSAGTGEGTASRMTDSSACMCIVHDFAQGTTDFISGIPEERDGSVSHDTLNQAAAFTKEAVTVQSMLGSLLGCPPRYRDDAYTSVVPFLALPVTRVILGRSAFAGKDVGGSHMAVYGRQSGGQQCVFTSGGKTLRNVEQTFSSFAMSAMPENATVV